jgi:hypothetical protein
MWTTCDNDASAYLGDGPHYGGAHAMHHVNTVRNACERVDPQPADKYVAGTLSVRCNIKLSTSCCTGDQV